jgi:heavy metal sensor kinase
MDRRLGPAADQIAAGYHAEGPPEARDVASTVMTGEAAAAQVLTPRGTIVTSYGDRVARAPLLDRAAIAKVVGGRREVRTATFGDRRLRLVARPATRGSYRRVVVAAESTAPVDRSARRLIVLLLLAGPAALAAAAAGGWLLARRALRPIGRMTRDAGRIGVEGLGERLPVPATGDEVARLAETLNTMLARIQSGVQEQQRLVADASHELRTPLAAMRAELDVSLRADDLDQQARAVLRSTLEEAVRLSRTVDDLLTLARADRGLLDVRARAVDLATVAGDARRGLAALAAAHGIALAEDLRPAPARGDPSWLRQAVGNLIDNAITYSPPGAAVTVVTEIAGGEAVVHVLDEGPGIPDDARQAVFDRFRRVDASRARATGGSGIGLAIVREIAQAHGGRAWVEPRPGGGSRFSLAVPAAPAPSVVVQRREVEHEAPAGAVADGDVAAT